MGQREILRARSIRERLLSVLVNMYEANPSACLLRDHVVRPFTGGGVQFAWGEIEAEIVDMQRDGLLEIRAASGYDAPAPQCYCITSKGRDFYRAGCPWDRVDEFSGQL